MWYFLLEVCNFSVETSGKCLHGLTFKYSLKRIYWIKKTMCRFFIYWKYNHKGNGFVSMTRMGESVHNPGSLYTMAQGHNYVIHELTSCLKSELEEISWLLETLTEEQEDTFSMSSELLLWVRYPEGLPVCSWYVRDKQYCMLIVFAVHRRKWASITCINIHKHV